MQGLFSENKEKLINGALSALLLRETGQGKKTVTNDELEGQFHALRRLVASKAGFEAFTTLPKWATYLTTYIIHCSYLYYNNSET